jgi:hypothetical protein
LVDGGTGANATKVALLRTSKSAVTQEQVSTMFNDESSMFEANTESHIADSNLYFLAADETTDQLYLGGSTFSMQFDGLVQTTRNSNAVSGYNKISVANETTLDE